MLSRLVILPPLRRVAKQKQLIAARTTSSTPPSSSPDLVSFSTSANPKTNRKTHHIEKSQDTSHNTNNTNNNNNNNNNNTGKMADMADEMAERFEGGSRGGNRSRGGGGGGGRKGGGGRSGGRNRDVELSKALSKLLRHQAASAGIQLDDEGYAPLDKVLQWQPIRSLSPSFPEILGAVRDSDKQRFALKPNPKTNPALDETATDPVHWLIRANQGHSIKLDSGAGLLKPIALPPADPQDLTANAAMPEGTVPVPPTVVHGTYFAFWPAIVASGGLRPMGRNHVHCSVGLPDDSESGVVSGMRKDAEVLVYVDVERSIREAGIKWWMSDNGVVLTEGDDKDGLVPTRFFKEVVGRKQDVGVLWQDGEKVADLPEGLKIRTPMGKSGGGRGGREGGRGRKGEREGW